ncbi:MAG TPA: class I SAM-dependent methyltransferase [Pyrinomonadaceae bacterium]|nr:class I SAM-dependent methyltransferase [Pyrinomonadaceae bacterium]
MSQYVERFSSRVDNYVRYRPGYPTAIVDLLATECGLTPQSVIADIGSGTGKLSEIFLANGNVVLGLEPNEGMRAAADVILGKNPNFRSINASAEATTLPASSVDLITAGQAFHWFDLEKTKREWLRILKPSGWAVIIWNERRLDTTAFLRDYEALLLKFGTDYQTIRHENAIDGLKSFFAPKSPKLSSFDNVQLFDFEGLKGRVLSSSYTPEPGHPDFQPMLDELRVVFDRHQRDGQVSFDYDTRVFYSQLQ